MIYGTVQVQRCTRLHESIVRDLIIVEYRGVAAILIMSIAEALVRMDICERNNSHTPLLDDD